MTRSLLRALLAVAFAALALALGACGDDDDEGAKAGGESSVPTSAPSDAKRGGTLEVLAAADVDHIDPGAAYYQFTYMLSYATQRPLYSYPPAEEDPQPDFAVGPPEVSEDGKTITIKTKRGIKFSPPVNREANAKDVKYAIERQFSKGVAAGYSDAYYGDLIGLKEYKDGKADEISGITNPDDNTIVFKLNRSTAGAFIGALSLPGSAPVPKEYAGKMDKKTPSDYGKGDNQVETGPYMLDEYKPTRRIVLVRNPNWTPDNDYRKAYLDRIVFKEGVDPAVAGKQILNGRGQTNGDFAPLPPDTRRAVQTKKDQIALTPSGGNRFVAMNTTIKPFDNENVRRAVFAVFDRTAMRLTRGGAPLGNIASHFIPPGIQGFEESGGLEGPGFDFTKNPDGDLNVAKEYLKKAKAQGVPVNAQGLYAGKDEVFMVGVNAGVAAKTAEVAAEQFRKLGFKVKLRQVSQDSMYTKFCNVPKSKVAVCPNVGWIKDFPDAQTILGPTFAGKNIVQENNSNWPQLDDPKINAAIDKAELVTGTKERAEAWGEIDKMVTNTAAAVPWIWDNQPNIWSSNVNAVINKANANVDVSFTSLK